MFVCSNERCDYLRRAGGVQRSNENAEKHPSTALRRVAVFDTELDALAQCQETQGAPAEHSHRDDNLRPMPLSEFGQRANEQWQAMRQKHQTATGSTYSDLDVF